MYLSSYDYSLSVASNLVIVMRFHSYTIISPKSQVSRTSRRIPPAGVDLRIRHTQVPGLRTTEPEDWDAQRYKLISESGKRNRSNNIPYYDVTRDTESWVRVT